MSNRFSEWKATQEQLEAVRRFEAERSELVKQVLIEFEHKEKLKKEGKKTKSK